MKARVPFYNSKQKRVAAEELRFEYLKIIEKERNDMTRRIIKTVIYVLHNNFGFGKKRTERMFKYFTDTLGQSNKDEVFWEHIDRDVIDYLGFPFERDFTENGHVISESDYYIKKEKE